jgi:3-deoxy-D-manno-octulosonic-acid transferase
VPETPLLYRALTGVASALLPLGRPFSPKLRRGDLARRGATARWGAWAAVHRDRSRPLLWCHAPSVGEGLQADAVLRLLRTAHPGWQIAYTFFSPSAEALARRVPADTADYLPYDTPGAARALLEALAPRALVFTKLDLWPGFATAAAAAGVKVGLVAGTVSPVSGRLRWPARSLTRAGYAAIDRAGAIAAEDAGRLARLGADPARIEITGDPRFDSALDRARAGPADEPLLRLGAGRATLVAGSTWPRDEAVLLGAFQEVQRDHPGARLIVVPHEPTPAHLAGLDRRAAGLGLPRPVRLSESPDQPAPIMAVDRVGVLATLYRAAGLAYVGGGFGRAGLHSVLEPAACGLPTIVGPRWHSSREAGLLLEAGGAVALPPLDAVSALTIRWSEWLNDQDARLEAGRAGLAVVEAGRGAAGRNARLVEALMGA